MNRINITKDVSVYVEDMSICKLKKTNFEYCIITQTFTIKFS